MLDQSEEGKKSVLIKSGTLCRDLTLLTSCRIRIRMQLEQLFDVVDIICGDPD